MKLQTAKIGCAQTYNRKAQITAVNSILLTISGPEEHLLALMFAKAE